MAERAGSPEVRKRMLSLADGELVHRAKLERRYREMIGHEPPDPEPVTVDIPPEISNLDMSRALKLALERERDSERYYRFMAERDAAIRDKLHHLHMVQRAFLHLWTRTAFNLPEVSTFADLAAIEHWAREYHAELTSFVDALGDRALDEIVPIPWAERIAKTV